MSEKIIQDPVTGHIKQPIGQLILGVPVFFGVLVSMVIFMPVYARNLVFVALILGLIGIITSIWLNSRPNLTLKFLNLISITSLSGLIAIRAFGYLWPRASLFMGILISTSVVAVHLLPMLNPRGTWFLRGELSYAPKTRIGKNLLKLSLALLPISGFVGATIGIFLRGRNGEIDIVVVIAGPLFWLLALLLPFSTHPISPWERTRKAD